jgi:alkaline phosphatase D
MAKLDMYGREERPWTGPRLYSAAIVGHTTEDSAKIWVRAQHPGGYWLVVCNAALTEKQRAVGAREAAAYIAGLGDSVVFKARGTFRNKEDRTNVFSVTGLKPGTPYYYYVFADAPVIEKAPGEDRMILGREVAHSFRTMDNSEPALNFALYSCNDPYKDDAGPQPWKHLCAALADRRADFVIGGGDQVYVDCSRTDIWKWLKNRKADFRTLSDGQRLNRMKSLYQDVYRGYWGFPFIQQVFRSYPNYMIWDDHEIMDGWGSRDRNELSDALDH